MCGFGFVSVGLAKKAGFRTNSYEKLLDESSKISCGDSGISNLVAAGIKILLLDGCAEGSSNNL